MKINHPYLLNLLSEQKLEKIETAVILGSGLGSFTDKMEILKKIPYSDIEGFPEVTVAGHSGELIHGIIAGKEILTAKGRFHYYEGYNLKKVLTLVSFFEAMNIKNLIVTNAAGLMDTNYGTGAILFIKNCIDFTGLASQVGDLSLAKASQEEEKFAMKAAEDISMDIGIGNYVWTTGPSYETPAEIQYMIEKGGDLVGMSTMPEIMLAHKLKMKVFPLSCATNLAAGLSKNTLNHQEVFDTAERVKDTLAAYVSQLIKNL